MSQRPAIRPIVYASRKMREASMSVKVTVLVPGRRNKRGARSKEEDFKRQGIIKLCGKEVLAMPNLQGFHLDADPKIKLCSI
jgi:hypothetical protein